MPSAPYTTYTPFTEWLQLKYNIDYNAWIPFKEYTLEPPKTKLGNVLK